MFVHVPSVAPAIGASGGRENRIPSDTGGISHVPPLHVGGLEARP
jgi:hypothetical protein